MITAKLKSATSMVLRGQIRRVAATLWKQMVFDGVAVGFRRDLDVPFEPRPPRISLHLRPLRWGDVPIILGSSGGLRGEGEEIEARRLLLAAGIPTCWVAATDDDEPCYMQWLFSSRENEAIRRHFDGLLPALLPDEGMLEYAYTVPGRRGIGIMPWATAKLAEAAAGFGARSVSTFTSLSNEASLKACTSAGFVPTTVRLERWRFFRHDVKFVSFQPRRIAPPRSALF
jgi:hypothetical protein